MQPIVTDPDSVVNKFVIFSYIAVEMRRSKTAKEGLNQTQHLYGLAVRVMHLDERRVARVDGHAHAHQRPQPVGVGRALRPHHEAERAGRRVDVQRVLHGSLLAAQEDHIERGVARRRYHLRDLKKETLNRSEIKKYTAGLLIHPLGNLVGLVFIWVLHPPIAHISAGTTKAKSTQPGPGSLRHASPFMEKHEPRCYRDFVRLSKPSLSLSNNLGSWRSLMTTRI